MEMPETDRPREKLARLGAAALKDEELMAILLGSGNAQMDVMTMAKALMITEGNDHHHRLLSPPNP